jgi:methyl-accepting chemotaxis protein
MDKGRDTSQDDADDGRWVSYEELAAARGIDRASAFKLTLRNKWRRQKDNKGTVTVLVPIDWLTPSRDTSRDGSWDKSDDMSRMVNALEAAIATLRERAEAAERRADQAEARREAAERRADAAEARAEAAERRAHAAEARTEALRMRVEYVTDELQAMERIADQARAQAQEAVQRAEAIKKADAARRARGYLMRFVAAWRGE